MYFGIHLCSFGGKLRHFLFFPSICHLSQILPTVVPWSHKKSSNDFATIKMDYHISYVISFNYHVKFLLTTYLDYFQCKDPFYQQRRTENKKWIILPCLYDLLMPHDLPQLWPCLFVLLTLSLIQVALFLIALCIFFYDYNAFGTSILFIELWCSIVFNTWLYTLSSIFFPTKIHSLVIQNLISSSWGHPWLCDQNFRF